MAVFEVGEEAGVLGGDRVRGPTKLLRCRFLRRCRPIRRGCCDCPGRSARRSDVFRRLRQTILDDLPAHVTFACPPEGIAFAARDVSGGVEEEEQDRGAREPFAERPRVEAHGAEVADGLDQQGDDDAGEGRGVVREGPGDGENAERAEGDGEHEQAHFFVAQGEGQAGQQQKRSPPEKSAAEADEFFVGDAEDVVPGVPVILAFETVVEIFELRIVVVQRGARVLPQEKRGGMVGAGSEDVGHQQGVSGEAPVVIAHEGGGCGEHEE